MAQTHSLNLRYTNRALMRLQAEHGIDAMQLDERWAADAETRHKLTWAGLLHERPTAALEDVIETVCLDMEPGEQIAAIVEALKRAINPKAAAEKSDAEPSATDAA